MNDNPNIPQSSYFCQSPQKQEVIQDILTKNALNISIGASGTCKTMWELQSLEACAQGESAFDLWLTQPLEPVWYVAFDRTEEELQAKFNDISIPHDLFFFKSFQSSLHLSKDSRYLIDRVFKECPSGTKTIVIDGIGYAVPDVISQWGSSKVISHLQNLRQSISVTLKIIHHTPKTKGADTYADPREKGLGSGTWCQMADTAIVFEKIDPGDVSNPYRRVWVLHNDQRGDMEYAFKREGGRLTWLPDGMPQGQLIRNWSLEQIASHYNITIWEARKKRAQLQANNWED